MSATICLDFDGVVHSYISGWKGATIIPDPPVNGTKMAIDKLRMNYEVKIYSTRCGQPNGKEAIKLWLDKFGIVVDEICDHKPPAIVYVDDRGVTFNGDWDDCIEKITTFKHWQRRT